MLVLKMVNRHLAKLTRQYTATQKGNPRALAIAEELSQVGTVRDQIQRIHEKLGRSGQAPRSLPSESPTVETLLRRLDKLARQFAEAPREDPRKSEIVNEITRLSFLADSLFKSKKSPGQDRHQDLKGRVAGAIEQAMEQGGQLRNIKTGQQEVNA